MKKQAYQFSVTAKLSPKEAIERINRVSGWWTKGIEGHAQELGDTFTTRFGDTFVDFKVVEVTPGRKVVWEVTDCNLHWLQDKKEWKDTRIVWEISVENGLTQVTMTHAGLVPAAECYADCEAGWNFYIGESLRKLLTEGKGLPDGQRRSRSA